MSEPDKATYLHDSNQLAIQFAERAGFKVVPSVRDHSQVASRDDIPWKEFVLEVHRPRRTNPHFRKFWWRERKFQ